jgi:molybdenum cofactor guanylyltransferase
MDQGRANARHKAYGWILPLCSQLSVNVKNVALGRGARRIRQPTYNWRVNGLAVFVLAGGRSRRMGQDKAALLVGGATLLERALATARTLTPDVRIVGPAESYGTIASVVEDRYADSGPLAGIHAALTVTQQALNVMLAVDLPGVSTLLLRYLVEQASRGDELVTVPRAAGRLQPLCAVYRKEFVGRAAESLERGANKIDPLFEGCSRIITEDELAHAGVAEEMFENVNTPEDFAAARRRAGER